MITFITVICFVFICATVFCNDSCPLDNIEPNQNLTQMVGRWYEYKKTTNFLANNVCTTYVVICQNQGACNVNLIPNGTNTGYTNVLIIINGTSTEWGTNTIYLHVDSTQQFVILWNCKGEETKTYELAVLMRDLSDEDTKKKIETLLDHITITYNIELETINNTLCSGGKKSKMHIAVLLIFVIRIFIDISNF